jgi:hypothetical protein
VKPVINLDDPAAARTIGRRVESLSSFAVAMKLQRQHNRLASSANLPRIPKGIYKFQTHEAADEWLMSVWTRTPNPTLAATRKSTTSAPSADS